MKNQSTFTIKSILFGRINFNLSLPSPVYLATNFSNSAEYLALAAPAHRLRAPVTQSKNHRGLHPAAWENKCRASPKGFVQTALTRSTTNFLTPDHRLNNLSALHPCEVALVWDASAFHDDVYLCHPHFGRDRRNRPPSYVVGDRRGFHIPKMSGSGIDSYR